MSINYLQKRHFTRVAWPPARQPARQTTFVLTRNDRLGIERVLREGELSHIAYPIILTGFLRHKLRTAGAAPDPVPDSLVTAGCLVTYMVSDSDIETEFLTFDPMPSVGSIPVSSLLGATMIGMRRGQKAPLLREDGGIVSLVILDSDRPRSASAA
ncbi:MAG: hypothetical protein RIE24_03285 [Silicimonas sp.]